MRAGLRIDDVDFLQGGELGRRPLPAWVRRTYRSRRAWWAAALAVATLASLLAVTAGREGLVNSAGWPQLAEFARAAVHPELRAGFLAITWDATLTTLAYAVLGTLLTLGMGLVGGVLAAETWWRREGARARLSGWIVARGLLSLPRGVHEIVWGLFLINVLGLNPLVGVLAIGLPYGAVAAKVFSELLDEVPRNSFDSLRMAGVGRAKSFLYALGPQGARDIASYAFYRFECSIRSAAILGIIGAGGLGFELALSFRTLRYEEMWTLLYALVALSGLADLWSSVVRRRMSTRASASASIPQLHRNPVLLGSAAASLGLIVLSFVHLGIDVTTLWGARTRGLLADILARGWPPDFDAESIPRLAQLAAETLQMSLLAVAVAATAGMLVAVVAARSLVSAEPGRVLSGGVARAILLFARAIPPPVWALLLLFVFFPGPLPGALALGVYNFGILGRLMAEVVDNVDPGPADALQAQGVARDSSFLYGVVPLVGSKFVSLGLYRWEIAMRETVIVGVVGAGGLGRLLSEQIAAFDYSGVTATLVVLVTLTFAVDLLGGSLRRAFR